MFRATYLRFWPWLKILENCLNDTNIIYRDQHSTSYNQKQENKVTPFTDEMCFFFYKSSRENQNFIIS